MVDPARLSPIPTSCNSPLLFDANKLAADPGFEDEVIACKCVVPLALLVVETVKV